MEKHERNCCGCFDRGDSLVEHILEDENVVVGGSLTIGGGTF